MLNFNYMKIICLLLPHYHPKIIGDILNKCVCSNKIVWLVMMEIRLKMKNRLHRFSQNKPGPRYGHKYLLNIKFVTKG